MELRSYSTVRDAISYSTVRRINKGCLTTLKPNGVCLGGLGSAKIIREQLTLRESEQIPGTSCTNDSGPALTVALQNLEIIIYFLYIADLVPLCNYGKAVSIISSDMIFRHRGNPQNPHRILPAVQIQHNSEKPSRPRIKFHRLLTYSKTCRFEY